MAHALVTGGAGFIGSHLVDNLLADGWNVTVVDNFDPFYARAVKRANIADHVSNDRYAIVEADICDDAALTAALTGNYDVIVHLAAKAGVRPSILEPQTYQRVNVVGTQNMLEFAKERNIRQFVFASSSSVYGVNPRVPWREDDHVLQPISPYASTKVSGELLGHVYSHLFDLRFIALRFFTVYGPRQRPDLAIHKFSRLMLARQPVSIFGDGSMERDYTYVSDIISGIRAAMHFDQSDYEVINLGNSTPVTVISLLRLLESILQVPALIDYKPEEPGDVPITFAATEKAQRLLGYVPATSLQAGLREFAGWLRQDSADGGESTTIQQQRARAVSL